MWVEDAEDSAALSGLVGFFIAAVDAQVLVIYSMDGDE